MFRLNPEIISIPIDKDFSIITNPSVSKSMMVVNNVQLDILNEIAKNGDINKSAILKDIPIETIIKISERFKRSDFISEITFKIPKSENLTKSLDLWVHTTNSCNLSCSYCYVCRDKRHMEEDILSVLAFKILEVHKIRNLQEIRLRLAGGEPMIRFSYWKGFLLKLKEDLNLAGCQLKIIFLTNATIINDEIIDFIKSEKCGLAVSLDGFGESHDKTRVFKDGSGSFEKVKANIENLIINGIKPYIMTVVSDGNIDSLPELTRYLCSIDLGFRFSFVKGSDFDLELYKKKLHECYKIVEYHVENGYDFSSRHRFLDLNFENPALKPCSSGKNSALIFVDGSIHLCQVALADNKSIGTIEDKKDLLDIIQSQDKYAKLDISKECSDCRYRHICASGCPLDRIEGKSRFCELFKEFIPVIYRLHGKQILNKLLKKGNR